MAGYPQDLWQRSWERMPGGRAACGAYRIPMYSNAAGIIPIVEALLAKGAALGTVLAFMMSVIGLSFAGNGYLT